MSKKPNLKAKIAWMEWWCKKEGLTLSLEGSVGFGRECIGIVAQEDKEEECCVYPDYYFYDEKTSEYDTSNGKVWTPKDSYHKHCCVAVLGQSTDKVLQLYQWLKWFNRKGFHYKKVKASPEYTESDLLMSEYEHRLVRGKYPFAQNKRKRNRVAKWDKMLDNMRKSRK